MKTFLRYVIAFWATIIAILTCLILIIAHKTSDEAYTLAQLDKMTMLDNPSRQPSIVLLGGSNVAFGFNSQMIVDSIGMPVINTAVHAGLGLKYMMDECLPRLQHGHVLVFSPELASHFYGDTFYGNSEYANMFYLGHVPPSEISSQQVRRIIELTPGYIFPKIIQPDFWLNRRGNTVYMRHHFNQYGDMVWHWTNDSTKHLNCSHPNNGNGKKLNLAACNDVVKALDALQKRGIKVVMFSAGGDKVALSGLKKQYAEVVTFLQAHGYAYPDSTGLDLMDNDCTYDTEYHLSQKGATLHTLHLIAWLQQCGIHRPLTN